MRRPAAILVVTSAIVAGIVAAGAGGAARPFAQGVAAGEITSTSAILWTRAPSAGRVELDVVRAADGSAVITRRPITASATDDRTVRVRLGALRPGTRYRYRFWQKGSPSVLGSFRTAPPAGADARVRFAVSGDADATRGEDGKPAFNGFETYARMAAEHNDFNVNLGDTIYSDSEVGGSPPALTVPAKWAKYRLGLALTPLRTLRASAGLYSQWDDHEFVNDFSVPEHGRSLYAAGVKAFHDYAPVVGPSPRLGLFRTIRWGRNVELFFLDARSFRSAKATQACAGDLAPTAPTAVRVAFATLAPPLGGPVPAGCLEAIRSPSRTMLGPAQLAAFRTAVRASTATWKIVLHEVPLMELYALPYDRWEGYAAERAKVLEALRPVENVVVLTTDTHAHLIGKIRTGTLDAAGPDETGIWEVITGPVATNTYAREIDAVLGAKGSGDFVTSLFLAPSPPRGLGLRCSATDVFGYAEVAATRTTLTVTPKSASGRPVREKTGATCAPLVLRAR